MPAAGIQRRQNRPIQRTEQNGGKHFFLSIGIGILSHLNWILFGGHFKPV